MGRSLPPRRPTAIIFDVGGVLCADALEPKRADLAAKYGLSSEKLEEIGRNMRSDVDEGRMTERAYWSAVLSAFGIVADDVAVDSYVRILDGVPELLAAASRAGYLLACLTNDSLELAEARQRAIAAALGTNTVGAPARAAVFSHLIVSADVGFQKPNPAIYECALAKIGLAPADCLFVDDNAENLRAAERLGIRTTPITAVSELRSLLDLGP